MQNRLLACFPCPLRIISGLPRVASIAIHQTLPSHPVRPFVIFCANNPGDVSDRRFSQKAAKITKI
jgi:hypothetical protein